MGEGSGRGSGRVGSDFLSQSRVGSGRVNVSPGRVGSGPRKVTRGQLWIPLKIHLAKLHNHQNNNIFMVFLTVHESRITRNHVFL